MLVWYCGIGKADLDRRSGRPALGFHCVPWYDCSFGVLLLRHTAASSLLRTPDNASVKRATARRRQSRLSSLAGEEAKSAEIDRL